MNMSNTDAGTEKTNSAEAIIGKDKAVSVVRSDQAQNDTTKTPLSQTLPFTTATVEQNKKPNAKKQKRRKKIPQSLLFLRAIMHFLFRLSLALFGFYFVGAYYSFLDSNLIFILRSLQIAATLSGLVTVLLFLIQVILFFKSKNTFYMRLCITPLIIFILSSVLVVFATLIMVLSKLTIAL